jgi:hypothetical protein
MADSKNISTEKLESTISSFLNDNTHIRQVSMSIDRTTQMVAKLRELDRLYDTEITMAHGQRKYALMHEKMVKMERIRNGEVVSLNLNH